MKFIYKKIILILLTFYFFNFSQIADFKNICFATDFFSDTLTLTENKYKIDLSYNKLSYPGESFFVKMKISDNKKNSIKESISAKAFLIGNKTISTSDFYLINDKKSQKKSIELLATLPMASWEKENENSKIQIEINFSAKTKKTFDVPVTILKKEYPHEIINLNQGLTDLVSVPSEEKKAQSKILNDLLYTINKNDVYELDGFMRPTTATRITSEFGQTRTFVYTNGKESPSYHAGLDFGVPTGTKVFACGRGKVVMACWRIVTGYSVIVEHLPGLYSIYYHLSELKCKENDIVEKGQLIALSGSTGLATGPHLHWEVRLNAVSLEPDSFVKK